MLWVGRELYLEGKVIYCGECLWNGLHTLLHIGLIQMRSSRIHLVAYRCPECGGFDLGVRGKLLSFNLQNCPASIEPHDSIENSLSHHHDNGYTEKRDSR